MKQITIILLSLFFCFSIVYGQIEFNPFSRINSAIIKINKVKEIRTYYIHDNDSSLTQIQNFDSNGNLIYLKNVSLSFEKIFFYSKSILDSMHFISYDKIVEIQKFKYFKSNRAQAMKKFDAGFCYVFETDEKLPVKIIDERGFTYNWQYDKGKQLNKTIVNANQTDKSFESYYYDSLGRVAKYIMHDDKKNEVIRTLDFFYDSRNNPYLHFFQYYQNNNLVENTIEYFTFEGRLIKSKITINNGKFTSLEIYKYFYFSQ